MRRACAAFCGLYVAIDAAAVAGGNIHSAGAMWVVFGFFFLGVGSVVSAMRT